jgi:hypothetical protein
MDDLVLNSNVFTLQPVWDVFTNAFFAGFGRLEPFVQFVFYPTTVGMLKGRNTVALCYTS